jgi:regulator of sigma E protease
MIENLSGELLNWLTDGYLLLKVVIGFSIIIFVHELGHFLAAKWMGVRVERFAVGFFYRLCGYRRGEGFTFGRRPDYKPEELAARGWGETDYCVNALPFGGYVKMMGEDDIIVNEQTGEMRHSDDPRAFANKPVGRRMLVVSAGVVFNLLFAILLYMFVFLFLGKQMIAPVLGRVEPASSAANAGLLPGDRILQINGSPVESLEDIYVAAMLSEGPLRFDVERDGKLLDRELVVDLRGPDGPRAFISSIMWMVTTTVSHDIAAAPDRQGLQAGDQVTQVDGVPVNNVLQIVTAFERCGGRPVMFTVERSGSEHGGAPQTLTLPQRPTLTLLPAAEVRDDSAATLESQNLLGLLPRWAVDRVIPGGAAAQAGFQRGDVIVQWGTVVDPAFADISASVERSDGRPTSVVVERGGQRITLSVTARRPFRLYGTSKPQVGITFMEEQGASVVADVAADTPAAALGMPRGAEILAVGAKTVQTWSDVLEAFKAAAGTTVAVRYRSGPDEVTAPLSVPSSVVNELNMPAGAQIRAIAGEDSVRTDSGEKISLPAPLAVRMLLERNVGRAVSVDYVTDLMDSVRRTGMFTVRADNVDPWQLRAEYTYDLAPYFSKLYDTVTAGGNPVRALTMGARQAVRVLWSVYRTLQSMVSPSGHVSVKDVSGPVGIVRAAVQQAETSQSDLLFFLAYISVNLAVINFVPLPVVDGGLMLFLILEKFRGRPLGLKTQVVTTLVGLGLIVLCFVLVTFQDIVKWASGSL